MNEIIWITECGHLRDRAARMLEWTIPQSVASYFLARLGFNVAFGRRDEFRADLFGAQIAGKVTAIRTLNTLAEQAYEDLPILYRISLEVLHLAPRKYLCLYGAFMGALFLKFVQGLPVQHKLLFIACSIAPALIARNILKAAFKRAKYKSEWNDRREDIIVQTTHPTMNRYNNRLNYHVISWLVQFTDLGGQSPHRLTCQHFSCVTSTSTLFYG